ncbi:type III toxin-antitoxin system ToxN/AbiQ family toxin [bacterium]|nr:type III toxin-antitoxin system ToxN/AbiQ family toxin [bacterium]
MKQERLNLYFLDMKYVRYLHNADDKVQSVSPQIHKENRPFVGIIVICDEHKYCVPLDSAKEKHKTQNNDVDNLKEFWKNCRKIRLESNWAITDCLIQKNPLIICI